MKYKVIAKDDLTAYPHSWTKGLDYEVLQRSGYFTLASNEGQVNYLYSVEKEVMDNFKRC